MNLKGLGSLSRTEDPRSFHPLTFCSVLAFLSTRRGMCRTKAPSMARAAPGDHELLIGGASWQAWVNCAWVEVSCGRFVDGRIIKAPPLGYSEDELLGNCQDEPLGYSEDEPLGYCEDEPVCTLTAVRRIVQSIFAGSNRFLCFVNNYRAVTVKRRKGRC
jgi:hypothetical protein